MLATIAVPFPLPFLAALLEVLTLVLATLAIPSNSGVGDASDGGNEDTTEAKAVATGSLPSRRWRFACVKLGTSAPERSSFYTCSYFRPSCSPLSGSARCSRDDFSCIYLTQG